MASDKSKYICNICGGNNDPLALFCGICGNKLNSKDKPSNEVTSSLQEEPDDEVNPSLQDEPGSEKKMIGLGSLIFTRGLYGELTQK